METRLKMSKSRMGHTVSVETRNNISKAKTGKKYKPMSDSQREHIREATIRRKAIPPSHEGKVRSEEWREKHRGSKSHWWKGGTTPLNKTIRTCLEYKNWREAVFTRDDWTCTECCIRGGKLEADHIVPFFYLLAANKIKSLEEARLCSPLWDVINGRTLCRSCHKNTGTFGRKAKNYGKTYPNTI